MDIPLSILEKPLILGVKTHEVRCHTMSYVKDILNINSELGVAAAIEASRLAEKYNKDFFDCDDLVKIMGVGKNNVRQLLNSHSFPTVEIGSRKVVSIVAFTMWAMQNNNYQ